MFGNPIQHVYIADGFIDDAEELIQRCVQRQVKLDFQSFCTIWREMNIGCLYQGRSSGAEVAELSEEVLQIAKHYMLANTSNYEESVAGLFLVYSLLNLQPYPGFAALRLVPDDVPAITRLETVARRDRRHDVLYILASILIKGSQYHAAERERGMEAPIRKYLDGFRSIDSIRGVKPKGVFYRQNEELDIIRELGTITNQYTEAKIKVIGSGPPDRSLQYIKEDLPLELHCSLRKIISGVYDEEDNDNVSEDEEDSSPKEDHGTRVESIKARAMKETVNPMKHLMGVEDRKLQAKSQQQQHTKSDIKSKPGKVKTSSPTKPQNSARKRKNSHKGRKGKKSKSNAEPSTSSIKSENKDCKEQEFDVEILSEENQEVCDDEEEVPINTMNLEIGYLPSLIRTDDTGQIVQIELIDNANPQEGTKVDVIQLQSLPDLDNMETRPIESEGRMSNQRPIELKDSSMIGQMDLTKDDNQSFQRQRNRKKTHLKSKFKRMGILPVANFHDPS